MFNRGDKPSGQIDTLIGQAARVHGDLEFSGGLHLDGRVDGNLRAVSGSLIVSETGVVEGSVDVPQVRVDGAVTGDIRASDRVVLGPQARVAGNVCYGGIEMAPGAQINGKLLRLAGPGFEQGLEST
jgi:cytoskeletal protein CcmA (bactofilin family)